MSPEARPDISYSERLPNGACASLVSEFWQFETGALDGAPHVHFIPPDGLPSIWVLMRAGAPPLAGLTGPGAEAQVATIEPFMRIAGMRLQPAVFEPLFGLSAGAIAQRSGPFEFFGLTAPKGLSDAARIACSDDDWTGVQNVFATFAAGGLSIDTVVQRVAASLIETHGDAHIEKLAASNQLSARHLRRRFRHQMGLTPKAFAQIRRVRKLCIDALRSELGWTTLSLEAGFADQAHMARNIQSVFGLRPGEVRARIRQIAHGDVFS